MAVAAALAVSGALALRPPGAAAGVTGSPHDFSQTGPFTKSNDIAPAGTCSACHVAHRAADAYVLWSRDLTPYQTSLRNDGDPSSVPNYVLAPTIPCYDCHDSHGAGGINNVPSLSIFEVSHRPQNIAFGFTKNGTGSMTEDAPAGSVSGYYENKPPAGSFNYGADPGLNPSDNAQLLKTGGHYFKRKDPTAISGDDFDIGDKLPCRDCHDPHAWSSDWQAFIKPNLGGTIGWGRITPAGQPTASTFMANAFTGAGARSDVDSRTLCIACHGDSDLQDSVNFSDISGQYSASAGRIVRPPDTIVEHRSGNQTACVFCHEHNAIDSAATCTACHLSSGTDSDQYLNGTETWFSNNVTANIDNAEWFWAGHGRSAGTYDVSGRPAANLLGGGTGDNPCLYCHDPNVGHKSAANPFRLKDQTGVSGYGALGWNATCLVCHGKSPTPPGYDPDGSAAAYANKAAAAAFVDNSHYGTKHGSGNNGGRFCWDCHDPHGDRNQAGSGNIFMVHKQRLARETDGVFGFPGASGALSANPPVFTNASTGADYAGGAPYQGICQVCHAATAHYTANSGDGHNAGTRCTACHAHDAAFRPSGCEQCHGYPPFDPGGGNPVAPNVMAASDNSFSYWAQSGHGRWAGDTGIPASYRPTCEACHDVALPAGPGTHQDNTLNTAEAPASFNTNTFHLKATVNGVPTLPSASSPDGTQQIFDDFCWLACHSPRGLVADHRHTKDAGGLARFGRKGTYQDASPLLYPPGTDNTLSSYGKPAGGHMYTDSALTTHAPAGGFWYAPCVSCHDPHGTAATSLSGGSNKMVRGNFKSDIGTDFCDVCHR